MNVIEMLVKAANNNHGRTLEPAEVKEVVSSLNAMNNQMETVNSRLDGLTRITTVLIGRLGGKITMQPSEFDEADDRGFTVNWNEEGDYIAVELDDVAVPDMQDEDEATDSEPDFDQPPLPGLGDAGTEAEESEPGEDG